LHGGIVVAATAGAGRVISVTVGRSAADEAGMTSGVTDQSEARTAEGTTEMPCMICLTALSLDDDRPKIGTVTWEIVFDFGLRVGTAVNFECPNGHSSKDDPELLKAFPRRRFP
jgi:hypothetical protein